MSRSGGEHAQSTAAAGESNKSVQRQMVVMNRNMQGIKEGISSMNNTVAEGMRDMSAAVSLLCSQLDEDRVARRKDRQKMDGYTKMVNRLCTATSVLSRRSVAMQGEMAHCSRDVARGLVTVTSALEVLQTSQIATPGPGDGGESEEATSRSSITPPITESRSRSERHGAATGQTAMEDSVPSERGSAARRHRK